MLRTLITLIRRLIRSDRVRLHTCMPGIVVSFNRTLRTADVQPAPQRKLVNEEWADMQVIANCPVSYPCGGGFSMTWDLEPGDPVMLVFAERNLVGWTGSLSVGTYSPNDYRTHDLNDAWVIPAGAPASVPLAAAANELIIGKQDGTVAATFNRTTGAVDVDATGAVTVTAGGTVTIDAAAAVDVDAGSAVTVNAGSGVTIEAEGGNAVMFGSGETRLGTATPVDFVALASKVLVELNKITTWAATHIHPTVPPVGSPTLPPAVPPPAMVSPAATKTKAT